MSLDYGYTCSIIDDNEKDLKAEIESALINIINEFCPYVDETDKQVVMEINNRTERLYDTISYLFENVRRTNEEMREQANRQISELENKIDEYKEDISDLEKNVNNIEQQLNKYEDDIRLLEMELSGKEC